MIDFIDGVLEPALWFLADWSLRWGLLIVLLGAWLAMVRPRRSATRYLLCLLVLVAGLVLPALPRWGTGFAIASTKPTLPISVPEGPAETARLSGSGGQVSTNDRNDEPPGVAPAALDRASTEKPTELQQAGEWLGFRRLTILGLASLWMLGAGLLFARRVGGWLFLERLRRTAVPVQGAPSQLCQACRAQLALRRRATLASHELVRSPLTLGPYRPMILVPPTWTELPEQAQRGSLLHELAHLARFDDWLALALELVRIGFFSACSLAPWPCRVRKRIALRRDYAGAGNRSA